MEFTADSDRLGLFTDWQTTSILQASTLYIAQKRRMSISKGLGLSI